jgi:hypothetical protein
VGGNGHLYRPVDPSPGAKVIITSDVDGHHHVARFSWAVVGEDGSRLRAGIDFAEFGPEGDLTRIVGFFDA